VQIQLSNSTWRLASGPRRYPARIVVRIAENFAQDHGLYLVIDVLLLISSIVLFEFQRLEAGIPGTLAVLLQVLGALILIGRDLAILKRCVLSNRSVNVRRRSRLICDYVLESQNVAALDPAPANPLDGDWPDRVLLSKSLHLICRIRNIVWDWICERRHRDLFALPPSMNPNSP